MSRDFIRRNKNKNMPNGKKPVIVKKEAGKQPPRNKAKSTAGPAKVAPSGAKSSGLGLLIVLAIIIIGGFFIYDQFKSKPDGEPSVVEDVKEAVEEAVIPQEVQASRFADYVEYKVSVNPQVPSYDLDEDLSEVVNADDFEFSEEALEMIMENGFVVIPEEYREFFSVYEQNRYAPVPNFITTDSILHNYHLIFNHLLKKIEEEELIPELEDLNEKMLEQALDIYERAEGTDWENAAKRNVAFFGVASTLLDEDVEIPEMVEDLVEQELDYIDEHEGIAISPVMNMGADLDVLEALKEDYSQYIPRGHYEKTEELKAYFKSMMWYGRMTFRFKSEDEVRSAVLTTLALSDKDAKESWERIYEPTNFFVGKSDDISLYEMEELVEDVYGKRADVEDLFDDGAKFSELMSLADELEPPQINSIPIFMEEIQPDREREIKGFRFMGQRYTVDASIFQRLIDREVKNRMLPKGLDIAAAMGSDEAYDLLDEMDETDYENYDDNMSKLKTYINKLDDDTWTQNLYWGWLHALRPLLEEKGSGYPMFMQNLAWVRKEINTFLGSWAELKHDTILYAKQVYAELGGAPMEEEDDRGYVEPNPHVYARLASLLRMTREGLDLRDLLDVSDEQTLKRMEELALSLKIISEKELNNQSLSDDEYDLIRTYGGTLEHFWLEALRDEGVESVSQLYDHPAAVIADVATDPNGWVLEEGIGWINEIYVVVPVGGELRIARGGVFSYYEFSWRMSDRLTDSAWQEMLEEGDAPDLPEWTSEFLIEY